MGSTGSGSFSDYPGTANKSAAGGGGATGGTSGVDKCQLAFQALLEDVANCDFYARTNAVPAAGTGLSVIFDRPRLFAVDNNGVKVGALPTSFNYLAACLVSGVQYTGVVTLSATLPVPTVSADFVPR